MSLNVHSRNGHVAELSSLKLFKKIFAKIVCFFTNYIFLSISYQVHTFSKTSEKYQHIKTIFLT